MFNATSVTPTFTHAGYDIEIAVVGYPGKSVCHGGLGWSTIALLRGYGKVAVNRHRLLRSAALDPKSPPPARPDACRRNGCAVDAFPLGPFGQLGDVP